MESRTYYGLGVHADTQSCITTGASLSTAPASPTNLPQSLTSPHGPAGRTTAVTAGMASPHSTLGQFCFGPATQQTVVTTTTTTTVSFPPLLIKPPTDLYERDPKQYPLAFSTTPHVLKKFCFDVEGKPATFHEAEDARQALYEYRKHQASLQAANGTIRSGCTQYQTPHRTSRTDSARKHVQSDTKRMISPPSLAEAAELASLHRRRKKPRGLIRAQSGLAEMESINEQADKAISPVTPDTDAGGGAVGPSDAMPRLGRGGPNLLKLADSTLSFAQATDRDINPIHDRSAKLYSARYENGSGVSRRALHGTQRGGATATPPVVEGDLEPVEELRPQIPPSLLSSPQQDASLPSPSLSPITAAANLARNPFGSSFGESNEDEDASVVSGLDLSEDRADAFTKSSSSNTFKTPHLPSGSAFQEAEPMNPRLPTPSLMDIPTMIDAFDAMPTEMQTYVMYQLLRRCAKSTLQVVAEVVNPALKCDPFTVLPAELGLHIRNFLGAKSLCSAAQVSRKWRQLINHDEKAWKDLLDRDGFVLPGGELQRAVEEGWGWQHPGPDDYEQNLAPNRFELLSSRRPNSPIDRLCLPDVETASTASSRVSLGKRKATTTYLTHKKQKRRSMSSPSSSVIDSQRWLEEAQGPNACAMAAARAVPDPNVGLPSLKSLYLFKALYRRNYLIRKSWMMEDFRPQHLAFRAHHRHVVTCLLFDAEKILTGSDDTNINIYDTKTGVLRNRLEGHEGGVWALQYEDNALVSGSTDRSVRVWDINTGKCLQIFQGHTSTVRCLTILKPTQVDEESDGTPIMMPKETLIITGSRDSTLRVWRLPQPGERSVFQAGPPANDRDNPYFIRTLSGHHNSVRAIAAHGDTLISGSYDCTVRVWKISTGETVHRLQGHSQKVYSVVLDNARGRCISGSMDNLVKVWSLDTGACLFNLEGHTSLVGLLDLSHDRLVSAAADSTLRIWDPENGQCKATLSAHTGAITCFQHDGQKVISGSDRTLKMWNIKTGDCVRDLLTDLSGVWQVRFDDRRCVAAVQRNNMTYIEVLDFGAARDGIPDQRRGKRIVVDSRGREIDDPESAGDGDAVVTAP
ncbi:SCF ubiquitin ligase complex subunit cdc4 [Elasticomyces elasticus]|nr:SCF ubiquitin ligase complex subunit cdc4 [Elasticomyces elasticus]